ncbi:MAG: DinB family protein [Ktedonobacterales bacterium]
MGDVSITPTCAAVLAAFDEAYAAFLLAFRAAPDDALPYVPEGDEYALGALPIHLQDPLHNYIAQLDRMLATDFASLDLNANGAHDATLKQQHLRLVAERPTGTDRPRILAELEAAHQQARHRLDALDDTTFRRTAPVIYTEGAEPYPTSAADIAGWLTDHYREHEVQTQAILADWQAREGW